MFFRSPWQFFPNDRGIPLVRYLLIIAGSPQLNRNVYAFQGTWSKQIADRRSSHYN